MGSRSYRPIHPHYRGINLEELGLKRRPDDVTKRDLGKRSAVFTILDAYIGVQADSQFTPPTGPRCPAILTLVVEGADEPREFMTHSTNVHDTVVDLNRRGDCYPLRAQLLWDQTEWSRGPFLVLVLPEA